MMRINETVIKKLLWGFLMFLLLVPLIQEKFSLVNLRPLGGSFVHEKDTIISVKGWLAGAYQKRKEKYLDEHFGFRNWFVRLHNQIAYSAFNDTQTTGVVVGKDQFLYQQGYIDAYYGDDFIGKDKIERKVSKLKNISKLLKKKNIDLVIVIAPGKASFYPENIPEKLKRNYHKTNYQIYKTELKKYDLHFLDFEKWFLEMKDTSPYPLFPKTGIHWSSYGELLAADSMVRYIEGLRNISAPKIKINKISDSGIMMDRDDDIEQSMNLMFDIPDINMGYPSFDILTDSLTHKPKALMVADSFYWGMFNWGIANRIFDRSQFWFYNKSIYSNEFKTAKDVNEVNLLDEVEKNEVVVLMATDANLPDFPFGFDDDLSDAFHLRNGSQSSLREKNVQEYIKAIKNTPEWLKMVKQQAVDQKIDLDVAIRNNAEFMVEPN